MNQEYTAHYDSADDYSGSEWLWMDQHGSLYGEESVEFFTYQTGIDTSHTLSFVPVRRVRPSNAAAIPDGTSSDGGDDDDDKQEIAKEPAAAAEPTPTARQRPRKTASQPLSSRPSRARNPPDRLKMNKRN